MYHSLCVHSFVSEWLDFQLLAIANKASVNVHVQLIERIYAIISLEYIPKVGMTRSYGMCIYKFLRTCQTVFPKWLYHCNFHQQCMRVLISLHPHQCLVWSDFLTLAMLVASHCGFNLYFPNE